MDRRKLADALRDATPATLREDADEVYECARMGGYPGYFDPAMLDRLAALALAVAEWMPDYRDGATPPRSLPAALAALIEEGA